jgi:hypothetical protein
MFSQSSAAWRWYPCHALRPSMCSACEQRRSRLKLKVWVLRRSHAAQQHPASRMTVSQDGPRS